MRFRTRPDQYSRGISATLTEKVSSYSLFESKAADPTPFEGGSASAGTEFGQGGLEE
jgi:hypothetical protein